MQQIDIEKHPRTVIISTHLIDEVTNLFEEVIILKEKVASLMDSAYFLSGRLEHMESIVKNKNIINKEEFGATTILSVFDNLFIALAFAIIQGVLLKLDPFFIL